MNMMYEDFFADRIALLRTQKNVSAREMSLAIGQNSSYINRIENKKTFPSMQAFFYICEYLDISPHDFFCEEIKYPGKIQEIITELYNLNEKQLNTVLTVAKGLQNE